MDVMKMVQDFVHDKFKLDVDASTPISSFAEDSLDRVEMLMELEEALNVSIMNSELANVKTVGELVEVVRTKLGK